ncbi:MAG: hypothetical protein Q8K72_10725, partial [Acidimicrobiales bacterium]|nr:hypothetical protein [Acidimicrobiales bacterium]
ASAFASSSHNHNAAYSALAHNHNAADINSGTLGVVRLPADGYNGTYFTEAESSATFINDNAGEVGNADIADGAISGAKIAAGSFASAAHNHSAADINSGTLGAAQLPPDGYNGTYFTEAESGATFVNDNAGEIDDADIADGTTLALSNRQSVHDSLLEDDWNGLFTAGAPYIGSWVSQNTAYTVSGCPLGGGLWGPGGVTWEAWYTVSASGTDGVLGARVEIGALGTLLGVADGGSFLVGWANAAPSHLGDFTVIGTIADAGGTVYVPGSLIIDGGTNHLVIAPAWRAASGWAVCGNVLVSEFGGPVVGGEANSGRGTAPSTGSITVTTLVVSGSGRTSWVSPAGAGDADGTNDT